MCAATRFVFGCLLYLLACGPARAQDMPEPPKPPAFTNLFPRPTGLNGYEDWVQAGDLIRNNPLVDAASEPDATLTQKRHLLADPTIERALHLLRTGLDKPAQSPHIVLDENTTYPEFGSFRKLARLLAIEQYIRFADGNVDGAIDSFQEGLKFGGRLQTDLMISGLNGIAINILVLEEFSRHPDQFSAYQCSRLRRLVEEWLQAPSPASAIIDSYRQFMLRQLETKRSDPQAFLALFERTSLPNEDTPSDSDEAALARYLNSHPNDVTQVIARAEFLINAYFNAVLVNRKLPIVERKPARLLKDTSPSSRLAAIMTPNMEGIAQRYDHIELQMRLLGVHAAIHEYRWEHNHLPASLTELHLGDLNRDPFTGGSLAYKRTDIGYDLHSLDPKARDE